MPDRRSGAGSEASFSFLVSLFKNPGRQTVAEARGRLGVLGVAFAAVFVAIAVKFAWLTIDGMGDSAEAVLAKYRAQKPHYERAEIVDRNGEILATTLQTASLYAKPKEISEPKRAARALKKIFPELDARDLQAKLESGRSFIWIKRHITPRQQQLVNNLGEPGLDFEPEFKRIYPHANLFSHVLGYVDVDGKGMAGIERGQNDYLRNDDGEHEPLRLSLDLRIQALVRQELERAVADFQAIGATGVVMDIYSGEVLALSNLPDFDPHNAGAAKDARFNRATQGVYEMGSTFKTFTMAMALEEGVANMHSSYDATKPIRIARFSISDSHPENRWLSLPEIFAYSSNIGTAKIIMDVGAERQRKFLHKLGMDQSLKLDVPETASPLTPAHWSDVYMMTISFGHGIAVTPMHLVRAIAAVAGDGKIRPITFLKQDKEIVSGDLVLSEKNVLNIRKLLRLVVQEGTAGKADAAGYRVGGKTGTAEKSGAGGYNRKSNLASFVGVFPIDNPKYVVLVMVDEPKGNKSTYGFATGGWVAAPVAGDIVARMGPMLGIRPMFDGPVQRRTKDSRQWHYYDGGAVHAVTF